MRAAVASLLALVLTACAAHRAEPAAPVPAPVSTPAPAPVAVPAPVPVPAPAPVEPEAQAPAPDPEAPSAALRLHRGAMDGVHPDLVAQGSGAQQHVPGPSMELGPVSATAPISNAEQVIAALRPRFRRCYQDALRQDPNMAGVLDLGMKLGPGGEVTGVSVKGGKGLSPALVKCLSRVAERAQFAPPPGGNATLSMPFSITRQ